MTTTTILGVKFPLTGKVLVAPKSEIVLSYLKAAKDGEGLAKKYFKNLK